MGRGEPGERPVGKQLVSQGRDGSSSGEVSGYQRVLEDESEAVRREKSKADSCSSQEEASGERNA